MSPEQLLSAFLATWQDHVKLPEQWAWAAVGVPALLALGGLMMMIRGARWAPGILGTAFLIGGLAVGRAFSQSLTNLPPIATVGLSGLLALVIGVWMFRLWQAVMLGTVTASAGLLVYYARELTPAVSQWLGDGQNITLRPAGSVVGAEQPARSMLTEAQSLWTHLATNVSGFEFNFWTVVAVAGVAGLAFGWLLPRTSRALWAATLGTIGCGIGTTGVMQKLAPEAMNWMLAHNTAAWATVLGAWAVSFAINYASVRPRPPRTPDPEQEPAAPAPRRATA